MSNDRAAQRGGALPPTVRILLTLSAAVVALAGMWAARGLIGPAAIAAVIVIICFPLGPALARRRAPRWVGSTAVILLGYAILVVLAWLMAFAISEFIRLMTDLVPEVTKVVDDAVALATDLGVSESIGDQLANVFSVETVLSFAGSLSSGTINVLLGLFLIFAYVIFMSVDGARYARAEEAFGPKIRPVMERMRDYCRGVRRYFVVNASFGLIVAVIDTIALMILDVPIPLVWGILAFVTNFVPNIGFILGLVPPAVIALVTAGWPTALIVVAVYCVVNVTLQVLVQPKFVSDAVGLSLTLSFFSVLFWTFVIGPLGAILAVPLTLLVRALVLESDPSSNWLRWLSGDDSAARK